MSEGRMRKFSPYSSEGFSSTPVKTSQDENVHIFKGLDNDVVSDDEDTFSLLSPIYHDSFDSDEEELKSSPSQQTSPRRSEDSRLCASPERSELPKTPFKQRFSEPVQTAGSPPLSAWEMWLLSKAKEDRLRIEEKAEKERLLKEKQEQQEREREHKKLVMEEKINEWLKIKREQERQKQLEKQRKEEEEMERHQEKQREKKAQQKYRDWLEKKNQEKLEREKKETMEAAQKEEQDRERRRKAEEKFQEWLTKANEKTRARLKTCSYPTSNYDKLYTAPSFCNPIPWKPIHVPPPEISPNKRSGRKPQKQKKTQQSRSTAFGEMNTASAADFLYRR